MASTRISSIVGPEGPQGEVGPAGPNTVPTQQAVADAITTTGSAAEVAVSAKIVLGSRNNGIALMGTSITAQNSAVSTVPGGEGISGHTGVDYTDSTIRTWDARGYFAMANVMLGQRLNLVANKGVGGNTTTQMLARFDADIIALGPQIGWVLIEPGPNDAGAGLSAATSIANITDMISKAKAAGYRVVLCTVTPQNNLSTSGLQQKSKVNRWIKAQAAETFQGLVVVDWATPLTDPAGGPVTSYFRLEPDGTTRIHPTPEGASRMGAALYRALDQAVPRVDRLSADVLDPYELDANPLNNGGTTVATSVTVDKSAGGAISGTTSKVARTDGIPGWWNQASITAGSARIRSDCTDVARFTAGTDYIYGLMEFQTDNDWTTVQNFTALLEFIDSGGTALKQSFALSSRSADGTNAYNPRGGVFYVPPTLIPAGTTRIRQQLVLKTVGDVGSATFRGGRRSLRVVGR